MHETVIAKKIVNTIKAQSNNKPIQSVILEVGSMATITSAELKEALRPLAGWQINVVEKPAEISCICGYKGSPKVLERSHDARVWECPKCYMMMPTLMQGDKIIIKSITTK